MKAEDLWGNPTDRACETLFLESSHPVQGLPETVSYPLGKKSMILEGLVVEKPGLVRILVKSEEEKNLAEAGPLLIQEGGSPGIGATSMVKAAKPSASPHHDSILILPGTNPFWM